MIVTSIVAFCGLGLLVCFFAICLITGFYWLAEFAEEYTQSIRKIIGLAIKIVLGCHVLLLLVEPLPCLCVFIGIAAHLVYLQLLHTFPYFSITSYEFIASTGAAVANQVSWGHFFWRDARYSYLRTEWKFGFMSVMVWLLPFLLVISLTPSDTTLPMSNGFEKRLPKRRGRSAILTLFKFMWSKRAEVLPTSTH